MGGGRSGKYGKGSKGQWQASQRHGSDDEPVEHLRPVDGRWHLNKASLRPYASPSGSPFYTARQQSDTDFLSLSTVAKAQQTWTTEICNRPGIALSEAGSTINMGKSLLLAYAAEDATAGEKLGFKGVVDMLESEDGKKFLAAAATFDKFDDSPKQAAALDTAARAWVKFLSTDTKSKAKRVQRMVKTAAKSYLFGMELLQWLAAMEHRDGWASKMKATKSLQPEKLHKWIRSPSDDRRLMEALLAAYRAQVDVRPEGKARGLSDSDGSERAMAKSTSSPKSDSSDSDDRRGEKRKKKAKKDSDSSKDKKSKKKEKKRRGKRGEKEDHPKKKKKASKDKKSHKTSSSSGRTSKAEDKKPSPVDSLTLKIRRVTGLTAEGRIAVKDTDLYDEIHFDSAEATLTDVLMQFFEAQSSKEEFDNWNVKALIQGKCVEISAPTTPATLCKEVVLIRKGG